MDFVLRKFTQRRDIVVLNYVDDGSVDRKSPWEELQFSASFLFSLVGI